LTALARMSKASWGYPISWMDAWAPELTITPGYLELHRVTVACGARDIVGMCAIEDHDDHWMLEHVWVSPRVYRRGVRRIAGPPFRSAFSPIHSHRISMRTLARR